MEFLQLAPEGKYDAVIVDSSDPVGMFQNLNCGDPLIIKETYMICLCNVLIKNGMHYI